jgi:uncharacterized protein (DUF4213/DUF364 family)
VSIAGEFLSRLERFAARLEPPRVRALHLPPLAAAPTREGEFCALELEDGSVGVSYVLLGDTLARLHAAGGAAALAGADSLAVARRFAGGAGVERTIGFAAVHALTACLFARAGFVPSEQTDSIGLLDPAPGDHVGMIGLFPSLVSRITGAGARLTVLELKAHLAGERQGFRVTLDPDELRGCNKVLSTSTILLNDTVDRITACCASATTFAVVGPGAGCLPDPLFDRGVTLLGGTRVVDPEGFREAVLQGSRWGASTRKYALRRDAYPGFDALLERAARP